MTIFWELRGFFIAHWRRYAGAAALLSIVAVLGLVPPAIIGHVVDTIVAGNIDRTQLLHHGLQILACAIGIYFGHVMWWRKLFGASYRLGFELRQRIYAHLLTLSPTALGRFPAGELMARASNDVQAVEMVAGEAVLSLIDGLITSLLVLVVMVKGFSAWLTLLALAPWPVMSWAVWWLGERLYRRFDASQAAFGDLNVAVQEHIAGMRGVRSVGAEDFTLRRLDEVSQRANDATLDAVRVESCYDPIIYMTIGTSFALSLAGGAWLISQQSLTLGELTSFTLYLGYLAWPMFAFGWMANLVQRARAAWQRIHQFLETPSAVCDRGTLASVWDVTLDVNISEFRYPGRSVPALHNVHFRLESGTTLGIVGPTGSGKSTLLALIARFYEGAGVHIRLGGHALSDYRLDALHAGVAYVMQDAALFSATVRENLTLARPEANEYEVNQVLRIAGLDRDIAALNEGLDTEIGERGLTLSGGQRQRLCLARALLGDARLLLVDDALSAIDAETEEHILGALRDHTRQISRVIVSHRLSAVDDCDLILVLANGAIVERGNHDALMARGGWYARTWRYQQLAEAIA